MGKRYQEKSLFVQGKVRFFMAIIVLVAASTAVFSNANQAADYVDIHFDFEDFEVGLLGGQQGWISTNKEVTVTDEVYAVSGDQVIKIDDQDTTKAFGARYEFDPIVQGTIEWWGQVDSLTRLVFLLEDTTSGASKRIDWIGFHGSGKFEYQEGATRKNTTETYQPDEWYRFRLEFDAISKKKTMYIFRGEDLLVVKEHIDFEDSSATSVNQFRIATISTNIGTSYLDNITIQDEAISAGPVTGLTFHPMQVVLFEDQEQPVQLLATHRNGAVRLVHSGATMTSQDSDIATIENRIVRGLQEGETQIIATYEQMNAQLNVTVLDKNAIPLYKVLQPRTLDTSTSIEGLKIVVPQDPEWYALGQQLRDELSQRWGLHVNLQEADSEQFGGEWSGHVMIIGNLSNHSQMGRLYGLRMSYADAIYPGNGGYQLLTLVDPFGRGGNTIVLGASDLTGAETGIERFLALLSETGGHEVGWLSEAELNSETASYLTYNGNPTTSQVQSALRSVDTWLGRLKPTTNVEEDAANFQYILSRISIYGELYQLTGHEGFGQIYHKLLIGYAEFANRYPDEAKWQLNERKNMWTDGDKVIQNWTVMEASPLFSEKDRKLILSALYLTYEANSRDGYLPGAQTPGPRWNHQIFPALSLVVGSDYFDRYHQLPEATSWKQIGNNVFTNNTSHVSLDEGPDYLMHVPMTNIDYAMAVGDESFIRRSLRPSADLHVLMINNLGSMSGGGDNYPFGYSGAYSWGHSQVLNAATWYFEDPVYRYLLELTRTGAFKGQRMSDLSNPLHRYATEWGGHAELPNPSSYPNLRAYPVDQGVYDDLRVKEQRELDVLLEDTFHKLAFRFGYELDDSYLALDGFSAGAHGHQDGNAIIGYTANGRLFLTDQDYIENTPEHHNGIVVVKDGEQHKKPPLARADWVADLDGFGLSRTTVPNYNGADWERTIISPDGRFFLIYDDMTIKESGDYMFKNMWQTLGTPTLTADQFVVEQQGVTMTLHSLDRSELQMHDRYGHFRKYFKGEYQYPYADFETVLSQIEHEKHYQPGDQTGFINVLSSDKSLKSSLKARRLNENVVEISEEDRVWLSVTGTLQTAPVTSNGKLHFIDQSGFVAAEVTELTIGSQTLHFDEPVLLKFEAGSGQWAAFSLRKDHIEYDSQGDPIESGAIDSGQIGWSKQEQHKLMQAVAKQQNPTAWKKQSPRYDQPNSDWRNVYQFSSEVTHSTTGDLYGDGREQLILGGKDGTVQAIDNEGNVLWTYQAIGRVNEVTIQHIDGETYVFVATELWYVHALNADGERIWSHLFPNDSAHSERKGNLLGVTNVRVAYVNGQNEEPWIMVGTQFRYLYGLDLSGTQKFKIALYYYGIEDMVYADFNGDGKEEGIIGVEYAYYLHLNNLSEIRNGSGSGPGWKVVDLLTDWSGQTTPAAILGTKQGKVHVVQGTSGKMQEIWNHNVGGEVNDIRHGDYNGDGQTEILAGSSGLQFYNLNADGTERWRVATDSRVLHVNGWIRGTGQTEYLAAADHGLLYRVNDQGTVIKTHRFPADIAGIPVSDNSATPWIVLTNGEVYLNKK